MKPFFLLKLIFYFLGILTACVNIIEFFYSKIFEKPLFVHFYLVKKKLPRREKVILENDINFYKNLTLQTFSDKYHRERSISTHNISIQ